MTIQNATRQPVPATAGPLPWRTLADGRSGVPRRPAPTIWRAVTAFWLASSVALVSILLIGSYV